MKLKLIHLSKEFTTRRGSVIAARDIHFETEDSEFFVLLGPSGCGKSTVLNLIAGLETPGSGEIWFGEKLVAAAEKKVFLGPKDRNVAMVFQSYAIYPHMSIFDNIAFPLRIARIAGQQIETSVKQVAGMLGIEHLLKAMPGELSGGQRQRVAIGRAIVRQPAIFLLDEPLSNLDAQLRTSTRAELKNLQRQLGITTLYVTHDQVEAMSLGHRIALLKDGRAEQIGTGEALYERPANTFVAGFIGSPPMNLLKSRLSEADGAMTIAIGGRQIETDALRGMHPHGPGDYVLGIRPEDISLQQGKGHLKAELFSVEHLGREILLQVRIEKEALTILTTDKKYADAKAGDILELKFNLAKVHFFEKEGEQKAIFHPE